MRSKNSPHSPAKSMDRTFARLPNPWSGLFLACQIHGQDFTCPPSPWPGLWSASKLRMFVDVPASTMSARCNHFDTFAAWLRHPWISSRNGAATIVLVAEAIMQPLT